MASAWITREIPEGKFPNLLFFRKQRWTQRREKWRLKNRLESCLVKANVEVLRAKNEDKKIELAERRSHPKIIFFSLFCLLTKSALITFFVRLSIDEFTHLGYGSFFSGTLHRCRTPPSMSIQDSFMLAHISGGHEKNEEKVNKASICLGPGPVT